MTYESHPAEPTPSPFDGDIQTGPYRPVTEKEIADRNALRAECEARFREEFARHTLELAAAASGKLTSLDTVRQQKQAAARTHLGQQAVRPPERQCN